MRIIQLLLVVLVLLSASGSFAVVYVDRNAPGPAHDGRSWNTAFLKIQDGVNVGVPNGEVWIADGTYVENVVMGEGVVLYGGFLGAQPGGYEEDLGWRDFTNHVVTIDGNSSGSCITMAVNTRVDGVTVTHGAGTLVEDSWGSRTCGGGFYCSGIGEGAAIENCVIIESQAQEGAGIYCEDASPLIKSNTISGNRGPTDDRYDLEGGGICCYGSSALIVGNTISNNSSCYGGGISCGGWPYAPIISGNTISCNYAESYGGGISAGGQTEVIDNIITENTAGRGGAIFGGGYPCIRRNTISGNRAITSGGGLSCWPNTAMDVVENEIIGNWADEFGGGISYTDNSWGAVTRNTIAHNCAGVDGGGFHSFGAYVILSSNLFVGNMAYGYGGGIDVAYMSGAIATNNTLVGNWAMHGRAAATYDGVGLTGAIWIANSILWDGGDEVWDGGVDCFMIYSDVRGGWPGEGNIDTDPAFRDPDNGDYRLMPNSLCIDAGSNEATDIPYQDLEGDPRVCDGNRDGIATMDIGADEYRSKYEVNRAPASMFQPAWVWFSIPLDPKVSSDASSVLGYNCVNRVFAWHSASKTWLLYPDDFTDLSVGEGYTAYLAASEHHAPVYEGTQPTLPFPMTIPAAGWSFVGVPSTQSIKGADLLVTKDGITRTQAQDVAATDPWLNWNWIYWDSANQTCRIMNPVSGGDDTWLHPWWGYRVWANTGDVTIVFP